MEKYIDNQESSYFRFGDNIERIIETISNRYIGENPKAPFVWRSFSKDSFLNNENSLYDINLKEKFPDSVYGDVAYAAGKFWSPNAAVTGFQLYCHSFVEVIFNGKSVFKSSIANERGNKPTIVWIDLVKGWNTVLLKFKHSASGFGCLIASGSPQWTPINIASVFEEWEGWTGWVYSIPTEKDPCIEEKEIDWLSSAELTGLTWLPVINKDKNKAFFKRVFSEHKKGYAVAWTKITLGKNGKSWIKGTTGGAFEVWLDGELHHCFNGNGEFSIEINRTKSQCNMLIKLDLDNNSGVFEISSDNMNFSCPADIKGYNGDWLYMAPLKEVSSNDMKKFTTLTHMGTGFEEKVFWQLDYPNCVIRPFCENALFGRWTYPLGVTLYGLLQSGRYLKNDVYTSYVKEHVFSVSDIFEYAIWEDMTYGYPGVDHQIIWLDALDDCGSFGSVMLETYMEESRESILPLADYIADYIKNKQERQPDGVFYRNLPGTISENTLWADDLYMSVPFLVRYYKVTGDVSYLEEAAKQFLLFKKYLYIEESSIMSHVYDFSYNKATQIPWGRGNGWVLFSLTELLEIMPEDFYMRQEILEMYTDLCRGYLKLQGENGLWHQVLTHPDSYEETSCTSMFAYSFARGVRFGWIKENVSEYMEAVQKAVTGLSKKCIDVYGNVYGTCAGSQFSFLPDYYKSNLKTRINDTHGIGIVLLALVEYLKLKEA